MATTSPDRTVDRPPAREPVAAPPVGEHAAPAARRRDRPGRATASLVLGILGILGSFIPIVAWVLGALAIGLGSSARSEIRRNGLPGAGQATAGIVLGIIAIVVGIAFLVISAAAMG